VTLFMAYIDIAKMWIESPEFRRASDQSLLVSLPRHDDVVKLLRALEATDARGVTNLHPAYQSLLVRFDALALDHEAVKAVVRSCLKELPSTPAPHTKTVDIPVRYGGEWG